MDTEVVEGKLVEESKVEDLTPKPVDLKSKVEEMEKEFASISSEIKELDVKKESLVRRQIELQGAYRFVKELSGK